MTSVTRCTCFLTISIVLCLSLPLTKTTLPMNQLSVYLPIVRQPPVLSLSEPVSYATTQYSNAVIGEVVNLSDTQAFSVTLQAVIYDSYRQITNTITFSTALSATLPRQSNPFFLGFPNPPPIVRSLSIYQATPISTSTIRPLTVFPQSIQCGTGFYGYITGSVRNDNTVPVAGISLYAWSLRNDGSRGFAQTYIGALLSPGGEEAFSTSAIPFCDYDGPLPDVSIHSFQFAAQGTVIP